MKRFLVGLVVCAFTLSASAQTAVEGNKFTDNWSIGINVGGTTPLTHSAFFNNMRPVIGLNLNKQVTPVLGLTGEVMGSINTSASSTAFDNASLNLLGRINLNNLFAGYKGTPRLFEVEALAGFGWMRYINNAANGADRNTLAAKYGFNLNFNLGESKAWTVALRPALVYDLHQKDNSSIRFNANQAAWEITAGLVYHFKSSNGQHHFTCVKPYNQAEVDGLNAQINALRQEAGNTAAALQQSRQDVENLQNALNAEKNKAPQVVKETIDNSKHSLESVITFRQGKTAIDASQLPNVERIATYLKNHKSAKVVIKGYASPEGSAEVNARIAKQRAEAVKSSLISKYKIAAGRIEAEGQGVGNMFEEADWNRVSICTINE
ncbi:OmpA family protein [Bacteroides helcogenes]|uniref:OmpA/MotB domain protein n=1 Tax=Bacteroides helcogenes (strain ATCC 35417 / DSM 20613 / JCM 6297 / CCUG 15421 / P 36-108) TaxID=693979 RepID=E6SV06_BACT6|nr:OmpA family protein [Bacteroides helcogenes]ADV42442.1 OmpA/MotB domain protein [Bacteroides helcogenes P 36-108]MDY5237795.1 OmpA family protein [Bacteroides helcogenes]